MFHTVVQTRFLRNGDKNYICVIDNLLRIQTVKELSKSLNSWWSYCKRFDTMFFSDTQCSFIRTTLLAPEDSICYGG